MADDLGVVFVVHCRRLRARRRALEPTLTALGWRAEWVVDFDPGTIPPEARRRVVRAARLRRAELSVYLKHEQVFRAIAARADPLALVLEDDALLPDGFDALLAKAVAALPTDVGLAYLGASCGLEVEPDAPGSLFGRERGTRSMSAVLVRPATARVVAAAIAERPIARPIDLTLNEIIRERGLPVAWSVPALVANGSETGRFRHSLGVGWRGGGWLARLRRTLS
jgi:GR25 family glycosyltransferase involved in LPS biosynthesis